MFGSDIEKNINNILSEKNIKKVIIPTSTGKSYEKFKNIFQNKQIVCVIKNANIKSQEDINRVRSIKKKVIADGNECIIATHVFGGVGRGIRKELNTYQIDEIIACVLRMFGNGVKVACEISLMSADAGLIDENECVLSLGGTKSGIDKGIIVVPQNSSDFLRTHIEKIIDF